MIDRPSRCWCVASPANLQSWLCCTATKIIQIARGSFVADSPVISRIKASRIYHETHIPTFQSQARTHARLSDAHENAWRPRSDRCTSRQRPQAPGRLSPLSTGPSQFSVLELALVQRLQTRPQFQAVLAGAIVARTTHFALHRNALDARGLQIQPGKLVDAPVLFPIQDIWIGAMVPKRWAKRAVTRNAIKRQIYTVSADFLHQYLPAAFVVRLRRGFSRTEFVSASSEPLKQAVRAEVQALMQAGVNAP